MKPMLAKLVRDLPVDGYLYEPKWDGFRCLAVRAGNHVELWSRQERPLGRYFPELLDAFSQQAPRHWTIDGEILVAVAGSFEFEALMARLHPARARVAELARRTPAVFVAFDLPQLGDESLADWGFEERRRALERLLADSSPPLYLTPMTGQLDTAARWLEEFDGAGVDGVVAKRRDLRYSPGVRAMLKVKRERTLDCVVAGMRLVLGDDEPAVASLLLGLYDVDGVLEHIGVASSFKSAVRESLARELAPLARSLAGHPWEHGFLTTGGPMGRLKGAAGRWTPGMTLDWVPLAPARVAEVSYTHIDGRRLRHPARFVRWRPDRVARSCGFDQISEAGPPMLGAIAS